MEKIALSPTLSLSRLVYGMWRVADDTDTSASHVQAKIESCLNQGITSFDQADIYGDYGAEAVLGKALRAAPALRDQMQIVTKCDIVAPIGKFADKRVKYYDTSAEHISASIDASLANMAIEQIDLLLIHRPDPFMNHHETGAALDAAVAAGKVAHVGVSNFKLHDWTLLQSGMKSPLVTNQIELSVIASDAFRNGDIAYLQQRNIAPMAWSPLAGGALFAAEHAALRARMAEIGAGFGVDDSAVAVAWLLAHPARIIPVLGTNNLDRIGRISDALKVEMDRETWFELYSMANGHEVP
ncbi:oxidoreductase [Actibacterium mucosum KCTC 23349]|uniref:Oxidoreductase n=1 Tax=Actibacterium mucosum KCTC 23349 TaxID=1454373 RepID=A0A037ZLD3_9RHOB|nr:aldo/keto reductase [Actibacterium mucosum]KAJ56424.1 oxidoreductase [Actibacterium mucosum KCTC 23349]